MKGKTILYSLLVLSGLYFYLHIGGMYTLLRQEEVQLFIPTWAELFPKLLTPGGACEVLAKALVQAYRSPALVWLILSTLILPIGLLTYGLLERLSKQSYHFFQALFPVCALAKAHTSAFYVLDGTVGILISLLFLYGYACIQRQLYKHIFSLVSTLAVYLICGQLVALYGILVMLFCLLATPKAWKTALGAIVPGLVLPLITIRWTPCVPLTDGIYSQAYQESQLQPDSYLYFVWIRTCILLGVLFIVSYLMKHLPLKRRWINIATTAVSGLGFAAYAFLQLPNMEDTLNNEMEHLAYLSKKKDWESIVETFDKRPPTNYIEQNFLFLALAKQNKLGNTLFAYNPKGPHSLLASWDHRYYTSVLLSDIHFAIGDLTLSESYAMEGLTLSKRGGSPYMMQRLVEISLIREEWNLANKYLEILGRLPAYKEWAKAHQAYLHHPERVKQNASWKHISLSQQADNLFSLLTVDYIWKEHLHGATPNPIAEMYIGCSYLLAKELEKFKDFLFVISKEQVIPIHFQEALLILASDEPTLLEQFTIDTATINRFKLFQQDIRKASKDSYGLTQLQRKYGDTYWFYYFCKN